MDLDQNILRCDELTIFRLRGLYENYGYRRFKMSKFEAYDLYVRNKDFLVSDRMITFTDARGVLMALKPDVTLSIIKNTREDEPGPRKVYYNETVYRSGKGDEGFQEIMQTGLECIGELDLYHIYEVTALAVRSLAAISPDYVLDVSHVGLVTGFMEAAGVDEEEIDLTETEYKSLRPLMQSPQRIFPVQVIYEDVWQEPYFYTSNGTVMVHIRNLRMKIEKDPQNPARLQTMWGKGYRFVAGEEKDHA